MEPECACSDPIHVYVFCWGRSHSNTLPARTWPVLQISGAEGRMATDQAPGFGPDDAIPPLGSRAETRHREQTLRRVGLALTRHTDEVLRGCD